MGEERPFTLFNVIFLIRLCFGWCILKNININPKTFLLRSTSSSIKESLKKRTDEAYKKGIFGAPSFISNNKVFWGQDRLEFALNEASK